MGTEGTSRDTPVSRGSCHGAPQALDRPPRACPWMGHEHLRGTWPDGTVQPQRTLWTRPSIAPGPRSSQTQPPPSTLTCRWPPPSLLGCPRPWPHSVTLDLRKETLTGALSGLLAPSPGAPTPTTPLPPGGARDLPDGLAPVTPQRLPDGLHAHLELGEAELLEESAVVGVLAGRGHEERVHCNESAQEPSADPARPPSPSLRTCGGPGPEPASA